MAARLAWTTVALMVAAAAGACSSGSGDAADGGVATDAGGGTGDAWGVDGGAPQDGAVEGDAGATTTTGVVFSLAAESRDLPIPFDFFTVADPATPTGLRVKMGGAYSAPFQVGLTFLGAKYPRALEMNDGWSLQAPIIVSVGKRLDTTQFSRADDYTGTDAPIWLFRVPGQGDALVREKILVSYREDILNDGTRQRYLSIRPRLALIPKTRYAFAILKGLRTALGGEIGASPDFIAVRDGSGTGTDHEKARSSVKPAVDAITAAGVAAADVSLAAGFTTMSIIDDYEAIDAMMESGAVNAPVMDLDPDGDGTPNVRTVSSPAAAQFLISGTFNSPRFTDSHGIFVHDAQGKPAVQRDDNLEFLLYLPKAGAQPWQVCIFQHGLGSDKGAVASRALPLLDEGIALIAIDAVTHGSRTNTPNNAALQFLNISEPATTRDNFRQTSVDHMQLSRLLKSLATMDLFPAGGDGSPDLDVTDICYFGNSLGAIIGGSTMGVTRHIGAGVLNVGGGTLMDFVETFIGDKIPTLKDSPEIPLYAVAVQQILSKGDPTSVGRFVTREPAAFVGRTKQILLQEAINDGTVPNMTTEHLARSLALPLLKPFVVDIWGLAHLDAPAEKLGIFQYDPADHNFIFDFSDSPIGRNGARARKQIATFARTWFDTGTGRIINPPSP